MTVVKLKSSLLWWITIATSKDGWQTAKNDNSVWAWGAGLLTGTVCNELYQFMLKWRTDSNNGQSSGALVTVQKKEWMIEWSTAAANIYRRAEQDYMTDRALTLLCFGIYNIIMNYSVPTTTFMLYSWFPGEFEACIGGWKLLCLHYWS